jgi:hypothetical protein
MYKTEGESSGKRDVQAEGRVFAGWMDEMSKMMKLQH